MNERNNGLKNAKEREGWPLVSHETIAPLDWRAQPARTSATCSAQPAPPQPCPPRPRPHSGATPTSRGHAHRDRRSQLTCRALALPDEEGSVRVPGCQELPLCVLAAQVLEEPAAQGRCEVCRLLAASSSSTLKHSPSPGPLPAPRSLDLLPAHPHDGSPLTVQVQGCLLWPQS
jgi:hypothetical protein